jgi:hypothetical protein
LNITVFSPYIFSLFLKEKNHHTSPPFFDKKSFDKKRQSPGGWSRRHKLLTKNCVLNFNEYLSCKLWEEHMQFFGKCASSVLSTLSILQSWTSAKQIQSWVDFFQQNLDIFQELFQKGQTQQLGFGTFMLMRMTSTVTQVI